MVRAVLKPYLGGVKHKVLIIKSVNLTFITLNKKQMRFDSIVKKRLY